MTQKASLPERTYHRMLRYCRPGARRSREEVLQKQEEQKKRARERHVAERLEALAVYGQDGKVLCCWPGCFIEDPDMLSLDHIADDGAKDRCQGRRGKSLRLLGYPPGLQTLCANHQSKKEAMRLRGEASPVSLKTDEVVL